MAELRRHLSDAGFGNVVTYIQSGNVALDAPPRRGDDVGVAVEALIRQHFGLSVAVIVRRHEDVAGVVAACPFTDRLNQPAKLGVSFANVELPPTITPPPGSVDQLAVQGRELYLFIRW